MIEGKQFLNDDSYKPSGDMRVIEREIERVFAGLRQFNNAFNTTTDPKTMAAVMAFGHVLDDALFSIRRFAYSIDREAQKGGK